LDCPDTTENLGFHPGWVGCQLVRIRDKNDAPIASPVAAFRRVMAPTNHAEWPAGASTDVIELASMAQDESAPTGDPAEHGSGTA
jgi:hypothetical protein